MKTVIFDLDRTLVRAFKSRQAWFDRVNPHLLHEVELNGMTIYIVVRSGARRMIYLCKKLGYRMEVYSAGQPKYVEKVVDVLTHGHPEVFDAVWDYRHCRVYGDGTITKPLYCIGLSPETTIHLDDDAGVLQENPECGLLVPPFSPRSEKDVHCDDVMKKAFTHIHKKFR